jgi:O-glycosyl hydrolase
MRKSYKVNQVVKSKHRVVISSLVVAILVIVTLFACAPLALNRSNEDVIAKSNLPQISPDAIKVVVDKNKVHQTIEGFGATHVSLVYEGVGDVLSPDLRLKAIDALFKEVGISMGNLEGALLESTGGWDNRKNDNLDPFNINWDGFETKAANAIQQKLVSPSASLGFNNYFLSQKVNVRWASPWLNTLRQHDYERYLDEIAEQVVAGHLHWREAYKIVPTYQMLFNEPLSGNNELLNGSIKDIVNIVKRSGERLQKEGFQVKFVLPNEETEEKTLETAKAVLTDPDARKYMGAIGYHPYPYGSAYSSIPRILSTSGVGKPDRDRIAIRQRLRDLGQEYKIPVWMTEVSHGDVKARSFESFLGRAIHIHDELLYADASAYFGMNNMWDDTSQKLHFGNKDIDSEEGTIVLIDSPKQIVSITGMGYAIGHYARWVKRGATRLEATSNNPLVQITAFWDQNQKRLILVAINNANKSQQLDILLNGVTLEGAIASEQSTQKSYWQQLSAIQVEIPNRFVISIPAKSVTTMQGLGKST